MSTEWHPCGLFNGKPDRPYAIIILNQPINRNAFDTLVENASLLVCADAGADWLYRYDQETPQNLHKRLPDAIVGDLDSISAEVKEYYRLKQVQIVQITDQYSTDFKKSLKWIKQNRVQGADDDASVCDVVVSGGLGGRVDQGFSLIHHLYMARIDPELTSGRIFLLSEQSLSFVLEDGKNVIHVEEGYFEENVGIIPVCGPGSISTKGLEWDVENWPTEFGSQMSTSNHIRSKRIEVSFGGKPPLFTMELAKHLASTDFRPPVLRFST